MSKKKKILIAFGSLLLIGGVFIGIIYARSPSLRLLKESMGKDENEARYHQKGDITVNKETVLKALEKGEGFLLKNQIEGKWEDGHPGITSLCILALQGGPLSKSNSQKEIIPASLKYLVGLQQDNGSFYIEFSASIASNNYNTALAILALTTQTGGSYKDEIKKAQQYLIGIQNSEDNGYESDDANHGGVSYGGQGGGGDLSNLQITLESLKASGLDENHEAYKRAVKFITRCQNSESNDQEWAGADGGFGYKASPDGEIQESYGAMTFAGLKSLLFCNVPKTDQRVQDALKWIRGNFTVSEHPGKGQVSLYYYYYTLSKALSMAEISTFKLESGEEISWKEMLAEELLKRQKPSGGWSNPERKYFEGNECLATAYAMSALNIVYSEWD